MKRLIPFFVAVLVLGGIFYAGWFYRRSPGYAISSDTSVNTYSDTFYGFSFEYPKDFAVRVENKDEYYPEIVRNIYLEKSEGKVRENAGFRIVKGDIPPYYDQGICLRKDETIGKDKISVMSLSCGDAGEHAVAYYMKLKGGYFLVFYEGYSSADEGLASIQKEIDEVKSSIQLN